MYMENLMITINSEHNSTLKKKKKFKICIQHGAVLDHDSVRGTKMCLWAAR